MNEPEPCTRVRLLEAAILCFAEKGFDATGIREIAHQANANSALVQYHFGGKTGLYSEVLRHIFNDKPIAVPEIPDPASPEARELAIQALGDLVRNLLENLPACADGPELARAALLLVTREFQAPREETAGQLLEHVRPVVDLIMGCLAILRPDFSRAEAMDSMDSILAQTFLLQLNLPMLRRIRQEPDFPKDLDALARHITEFSLRGLGVQA
jgi:TetR/AcrR family transcriptional regulator, regulator of cefoperazone and chloramphenicol sensitivity